jgi:hypothetical protein
VKIIFHSTFSGIKLITWTLYRGGWVGEIREIASSRTPSNLDKCDAPMSFNSSIHFAVFELHYLWLLV